MTTWIPRPRHPDEPACWSWPVPPLETAAEMAARFVVEGRDPGVLRYVSADRERFHTFHGGRCAVCESPFDLVEDHCHATGQVRGFLCRGDNVAEGKSSHPLFEAYRAWHPAAILDLHKMYHDGIWWFHGWSVMEHRAATQTLGVRPATPWSAWDLNTPVPG